VSSRLFLSSLVLPLSSSIGETESEDEFQMVNSREKLIPLSTLLEHLAQVQLHYSMLQHHLMLNSSLMLVFHPRHRQVLSPAHLPHTILHPDSVHVPQLLPLVGLLIRPPRWLYRLPEPSWSGMTLQLKVLCTINLLLGRRLWPTLHQ